MEFNPGGCCCRCDLALLSDLSSGMIGTPLANVQSCFHSIVDDAAFSDLKKSLFSYQWSVGLLADWQLCTQNATLLGSAIDAMRWFNPVGGVDSLEAIYEIAKSGVNGNRTQRAKVIVWAGHGPAASAAPHSQADVITALGDNHVRLLALNVSGSGTGIDDAGQAAALVAGGRGTLLNHFGALDYSDIHDALLALL